MILLLDRPPPIVTKDTAIRQHAADDDDVSMENWDDVAETNGSMGWTLKVHKPWPIEHVMIWSHPLVARRAAAAAAVKRKVAAQ